MLKAENWVVKSNALIESKGNFSTLELKVILGLISEIKLEDKDLQEYELEVDEMQRAIGTSAKNFYDELKKACQKLVSKTLTIENEIDSDNPKKLKKRKSFAVINYLSYAEYVDGQSKIKLVINPFFKPYLLDLKGSFTKYQLKNVLTLKSQYSIRIYELIKPMEDTSHQKRKIDLTTLKEYLGLEKSYKAFKDFEKNVLKVAEKQISEHTDITVTYEKIKKGRQIHAIEFHVKEKEYVRTEQQLYYDEVGTELAETIRERIEISKTFSDVQVMELYEIASSMTSDLHHIDRFEYMTLNYYYALSKKPSNLFAYYKKAIENDYAKACENTAR